MANEYTVHLPTPHPKQMAFLRCGKKRIVVKAGRRGGKTIGVSVLAVEKFLLGKRVLYAAPTQEQIDRFWETVKRALREPIEAGVFYKNETRHIIELVGSDQRIRAKTAWSADTLRGDYADVLILDEYQLMNEDAWEVVGAPMLLDNNGDAVFVYTPPSFRTAGTSKAKNKKHATAMFNRAKSDTSGRWQAFHFSSHDNPHISQEALSELTSDMTALAFRQEILAEDIDEIPGALWTRAMLDSTRLSAIPDLDRIVVGVDPKSESGANSECGIVVAGAVYTGTGKGRTCQVYILDDMSINGTPEQWGAQVVAAYNKWEADRIVAETNNGGEMVRSVLNVVEGGLPIHEVKASRGKATRAEPVAALYERSKAHHVGTFTELEDQLCSWVPGDKSPDRLDALVWAISFLINPSFSTMGSKRRS